MLNLALDPITSASLGERVAGELRQRIIVGEMAGGTRIVEEDLAAAVGVSRGPVRDAITILRAEGLVEGKGRNVAVRALTEADIDELMMLREAFEAIAIEHAIATRPKELAADLDTALEQMDTAAADASSTDFTAADLRFHNVFFLAAGLPRLSVVWNQFLPTIEGLLLVSGKQMDDLGPSALEHRMLARLITTGQTESALTELHSHLAKTRLRLKQVVAPQVPSMERN